MLLNSSFKCLIFILNMFHIRGYLIGEPCRYDEDCFVEHSFCEMQQICQCRENFVETEDRETCIAMIGAYCHSKHDCSSLPHSDCIEDSCECAAGFIPDPQAVRCLPVASHYESSCAYDKQCQLKLGYQSHCTRGQCKCLDGHHFAGTLCLQSKGLGVSCFNDSECFIGNNYRDTVECRSQCVCRSGYHETPERLCRQTDCGSGGTLPALPLLLAALLSSCRLLPIDTRIV